MKLPDSVTAAKPSSCAPPADACAAASTASMRAESRTEEPEFGGPCPAAVPAIDASIAQTSAGKTNREWRMRLHDSLRSRLSRLNAVSHLNAQNAVSNRSSRKANMGGSTSARRARVAFGQGECASLTSTYARSDSAKYSSRPVAA